MVDRGGRDVVKKGERWRARGLLWRAREDAAAATLEEKVMTGVKEEEPGVVTEPMMGSGSAWVGFKDERATGVERGGADRMEETRGVEGEEPETAGGGGGHDGGVGGRTRLDMERGGAKTKTERGGGGVGKEDSGSVESRGGKVAVGIVERGRGREVDVG